MKIVLFGPGNSIHMERWIKWFKKRGDELFFITNISNPNISKEQIVLPHENHRTIPGYFTFRTYQNIKRAKKIVKKIDPDIVHIHYISNYLPYNVDFSPIISSAWGTDVFRVSRGDYGYKFALRNINRSELVTTTSDVLVDLINEKYNYPKERILKFSWGIDLDIFYQKNEEEVRKLKKKLEIRDNKTVFISPRGLNEPYRPEYVIDSFHKVSKRKNNIHLIVLYGTTRPERFDAIKNYIQNLNNPNITLIDHLLDSNTLSLYYSISDYYIGVPVTDQLSAALLESMACGCIPIVSDLPPYGEVIINGKNGYVINAKRKLVDSIEMALDEMDKHDKWRGKNRALISEHHNWDIQAKMMYSIYNNMIK